jgi:hypothetical protein
LEVGREEFNAQEDGAEPIELGGEIHEGATAVEASDARVPIKEPVQGGVQAARVEDSRSSEERKMAE